MAMIDSGPRDGRRIGSRFVEYVDWSVERIERLKSLYHAGLSASQIAAELGGISRNSVIGKCHRLGLASRPRGAKPAPVQPRVQRRASNYARSDNRLEPTVKSVPLPEPRAEDQDIPIAQRKTLLQLTATCCRFPVGEPDAPDFFFCGAEAVSDHPYCADHCARAYDKATTSRSRRNGNRPIFSFVVHCDKRGTWR